MGDLGVGKSSTARFMIHAVTGKVGEASLGARGGGQKVGRYVICTAGRSDDLSIPDATTRGSISLTDTEGMELNPGKLQGISDAEVAKYSYMWTIAHPEGIVGRPTPKVMPNATWLVFDGEDMLEGFEENLALIAVNLLPMPLSSLASDRTSFPSNRSLWFLPSWTKSASAMTTGKSESTHSYRVHHQDTRS